ncbi:MAG: N-6 DNA methylase [Planctomycetota bacterium]|nr:N-6 DNA methylase [Planctomycetota bacterium]
MPLDAFKPYLKALETQLRAGNASERSHYPALEALLRALDRRLTVTIEPAGIPDASVDFLIRRGQRTIGYVEAKDIGKSLDEAERSEQLKRYRDRFTNLILTDFLEFRWYTDGERRRAARLGEADSHGRINPSPGGPQDVLALMEAFLSQESPSIARPKALAERLAHLAQELRDLIVATFRAEREKGHLHAQFDAFRETLIHDLSPDQFADMYAQTVAYGLFAARAQNPGQPDFSRERAVFDIPRTNPFLRRLFTEIAGPQLDQSVAWVVTDIADTIGQADFSEILKDFGRRTRKEDPIVHFYETFLAAFDPKVREMRGVYYTPEPVVSYIVRSADHILRERFSKKQGLAEPEVFILDPACGTGTFLFFVIRAIYDAIQGRGQRGTFSPYVAERLLPRLFGFELLMAPYAVAHMKLGIELKDLGYRFDTDERLGVYLTNTLEEAVKRSDHLWAQWIADEANAAADVKTQKPIMLVLGNPPYSGHSANASWRWVEVKGKPRKEKTWIGRQLEPYFECDGAPLGEKNPKWLQDDYVKFIRFGQWRIGETGRGVLAFVTNHAYLDNPTFRGMRQSLMKSFDDIYILDLHGNYRKKETSPDGSKDENVFDIQQGVAIGIFVKDGSRKGEPARVHHADLWGLREAKHAALFERNLSDTDWADLEPRAPFYLFVPRDTDRAAEYEQGWSLPDALPISSVGVVTSRDDFVVDSYRGTLEDRIKTFMQSALYDAAMRFNLKDKTGWTVSGAQEALRKDEDWAKTIVPFLYRPFDARWLCYHDALIERSRREVMRHILQGENLGLISARSNKSPSPDHFFCTRLIMETKCGESTTQSCLLPLYLYPERESGREQQKEMEHAPAWPVGKAGRVPNLEPKFVEAFAEKLGLRFISDGAGDRKKTFGPEDIFHYAYAVFHCPTYRKRYAEFLKTDFPRLSLTSDKKLFCTLCDLGAELVALHLLESPKVQDFSTAYPVDGDHLVAKGHPKYKTAEEVARGLAPRAQDRGAQGPALHSQEKARRVSAPAAPTAAGRVYINDRQYFDGVPPDVWEFCIGGYQVAEKWLKDRRARCLSIEDLNHYQKVIVALSETIRLMAAIDAAIPAWPLD